MGNHKFSPFHPTFLLTAKTVKFYRYRWNFLGWQGWNPTLSANPILLRAKQKLVKLKK